VVETQGLSDATLVLIDQVREQCPMVEIVAISSDPLVEESVQAFRHGVFAVLSYPVSDGQLADVIRNAYRRKLRGEARIKKLDGPWSEQ